MNSTALVVERSCWPANCQERCGKSVGVVGSGLLAREGSLWSGGCFNVRLPTGFSAQKTTTHPYPGGVSAQSFTVSDTDASAAFGVFHAVFGDHGSYSTLSLSELRRSMQKAALTCVKKSHVSFLGQT